MCARLVPRPSFYCLGSGVPYHTSDVIDVLCCCHYNGITNVMSHTTESLGMRLGHM